MMSINKMRFTYLCFFLTLSPFIICAKNKLIDSTIISIQIKPKKATGFYYYDGDYQHKILVFRNQSDTTAFITKKIFLNRPTEFEHSTNHTIAKKIINTLQHFYLEPSSITRWLLRDDYNLAPINNIDQNIFIESIDSLNFPVAKKEIEFNTKEKFLAYLQKIEIDYNANIVATNNLINTNQITLNQGNYWRSAFECKYIKQFFMVVNGNSAFLPLIKSEIDNKISGFLTKLPLFQKTSFRGLIDAERSILYYLGDKSFQNNFDMIANFALSNFKETAVPCLIGVMQMVSEIGNNRYKISVDLIKKQANSIQLRSIELLTNNDIDKPESYLLGTVNRKSTRSFKSLLDENKGKLILLDFWASWCIPCRAEIPSLKKLEVKYKRKSIAFISISLDEDNKIDEWVAALRKENLYTNPNQYRLISPKTSILLKYVNVSAIPRYVLLDREGKILDKNFLRPSDENFENEINRHLNSY